MTQTLNFLHHTSRISILEISKRLGRSQSFLWSLCNNLALPMRTVCEANQFSARLRTKRVKTSIGGSTDERSYLQGFAHGDLDVRRASSIAIVASSTSTHRAFASLFESLFRDYGPIYRYPVFDKTSGYRWKVAARLDNSFSFLLPEQRRHFPTAADASHFFAWLAGIIDSDGSIGIIHSGEYVRFNLEISNQDLPLLLHIRRELGKLGYSPTGPYKRRSESYVTPNLNIKYRQDMYCLAIQRVPEAKEILTLTPLSHAEKCKKKEYVLALRTPAKWDAEERKITAMRDDTDCAVQQFIQQARESYENRRVGKAT